MNKRVLLTQALCVLAAIACVHFAGDTERIQKFFFESVFILATGIVANVYLQTMSSWINNKSIAWAKNHKAICYFGFSVPVKNIAAPCMEEFIFRMPILVYFKDTLDPNFWYCNVAISVLFGIAHLGNVIPSSEDRKEAEKVLGSNASIIDHGKYVTAIVKKKNSHLAVLANACFAMMTGILLGYVVVRYQTLWASVALHSFINFIAPILAILLILAVSIFTLVFVALPVRLYQMVFN